MAPEIYALAIFMNNWYKTLWKLTGKKYRIIFNRTGFIPFRLDGGSICHSVAYNP
jgi:hypothetical protein